MIPANSLPPKEFQPQRIYKLKEFESYPDPLNSTEELLDKQVAAGRGDSPAILFADKVITYKQLLGAACKIGNALRKLGVEEGDRVLLRSPNVPPALFTNFGVLRLGAVMVPTSRMLSPNEIAHIANNAEAKVIVVAAAFAEGVVKARPNLKTVKHVIVFGGKPEELKAQGGPRYQGLVCGGAAAVAPGPP